MKLYAGFECGWIPWTGIDLLELNRHTPETEMRSNHSIARSVGARGARDGLPPGHDPKARVDAASLPTVWDMVHYHTVDDPVAHAWAVQEALGGVGRAVAVNEPTYHAEIIGDEGSVRLVRMSVLMMRSAPGLKYYTSDPIHDLSPETLWATDELVASGCVSTVGVNYYPHCRPSVPIEEVVEFMKDRYRLPVAITETGCHDGHPDNPPGLTRYSWRDRVMALKGVEFICWYPFFDQLSWEGNGEVWRCGYVGRHSGA